MTIFVRSISLADLSFLVALKALEYKFGKENEFGKVSTLSIYAETVQSYLPKSIDYLKPLEKKYKQ